MKVLVATKETQGKRDSDFSFVPEEELVTFEAFQCSGEKIEGKCGCKRSMVGIECHKSTTTMKIVERDITPAQLKEMIVRSMQKSGWGSGKDVVKFAQENVDNLIGIAEHFPLNSILEKRGRDFNCRS